MCIRDSPYTIKITNRKQTRWKKCKEKTEEEHNFWHDKKRHANSKANLNFFSMMFSYCLLYTSDAADERSSVDLGGRRIIKKKKK